MGVSVTTSVQLNKDTFDKLQRFPGKFLHGVARKTLDLTHSYIPLSNEVNNGRLRRSSMVYGVKQHSNTDYSIGSQVSYAKCVWVMDNARTNWTTPGTGSKWYETQFKKKGKSIVTSVAKNSL